MFSLSYEKIEYSAPWDNIEFIVRMKLLKTSTQKVVYYCHEPNISTFRYRVYNMIHVINEFSSKYSATYFCDRDFIHIDEIIENSDILILSRIDYSHHINYIITKAQAKNIPIYYDIDDLVFNPSYTHLLMNTLDKNLDDTKEWDYWFSYITRKSETLKLCGGAITTNEYLAKHIKHYTDKPAYIIPNFFNQEQYKTSLEIYQQKNSTEFKIHDDIYLGYFSGSSTHNHDFNLISSALIKLLNNNKNLKLRVGGILDIHDSLTKYMDRIELHTYQDYLNLQNLVGATEINLIPLQNNIFTNCKSELKYFEAAICGTISIATPTYIYNTNIQDGINGFIAHDFEWYNKIQHIINNLGNYSKIAQNAFNHAVENYAWFNQYKKIEEVLDNITLQHRI